MKVLLAVQVISASVADGLKHMRLTNKEFEDCEATVEFLNLFNDLFDMFNSNQMDEQGFKKPLCESNFDLYNDALKYAQEYIKQFSLSDGTPIIDSKCKTGFVGFLIAIDSFRLMYAECCEASKPY